MTGLHSRPAGERSSAGRAALSVVVVAVLAGAVLAADQSTKNLALAELPERTIVPVWGDVLQFYLTFNPGAAFSLGENVTWVFTLVLAGAAGAVIFLTVTRVRSALWSVVLGLLLGGILGNLTDRLFRSPGFPVGHVVDFIHTPWMMPAIYNVADVFIVSMMIAVALLVLLGRRLDGSRDSRRGRESAHGHEADGASDEIADAPVSGASRSQD